MYRWYPIINDSIISVSDYRRRFSTAQNEKFENFIFVPLKFNNYIFICSPVMQIKFQARRRGAATITRRCTCHHTFAFNIIPVQYLCTNSSRGRLNCAIRVMQKYYFGLISRGTRQYTAPSTYTYTWPRSARVVNSFFGPRMSKNPTYDSRRFRLPPVSRR